MRENPVFVQVPSRAPDPLFGESRRKEFSQGASNRHQRKQRMVHRHPGGQFLVQPGEGRRGHPRPWGVVQLCIQGQTTTDREFNL